MPDPSERIRLAKERARAQMEAGRKALRLEEAKERELARKASSSAARSGAAFWSSLASDSSTIRCSKRP
jgi:hypothetical protein